MGLCVVALCCFGLSVLSGIVSALNSILSFSLVPLLLCQYMAQKWPSNEREFLRRFPVHESSTIHNLPRELKSASGSAWSAKHLQACRVLVQDYSGNTYSIPILNDYKTTATARVAADRSLLTSLTSFSYEELRSLSHRALRSVPSFGSFFVSLADVTRVRSQSLPSRRLRENIQAPERPKFRSGEGEGFSSSPPIGSSPFTTVSSTYSPRHLNERPDFEEQIDRKKHEVVSANMAAQFISIVIDLYSSQPDESITTEFFNAPNTFYLISPHLNCICQDDGAAWRREFNPITKTWMNPQSELLYSLEVKSSYFQVDSSGIGATSDSTLAQQFCELLGSELSQVVDGDYEALDDERRW